MISSQKEKLCIKQLMMLLNVRILVDGGSENIREQNGQ